MGGRFTLRGAMALFLYVAPLEDKKAMKKASQPSVPLLSLRDFISEFTADHTWTPTGPVLLRQAFVADDIRAVGDPDKHTLDITISTGRRDRMNDTIAADGWDIRAFKKNPVVLWAHNYSTPPIGRATQTGLDETGKKLRSTAEFMPAEVNPFAETIYQMYLGKWMRAFSVGFVPKEWEWNEKEEGLDFTKQELLEYSAVPVPANSDALAGARSAGIDLEPLIGWAEQVLDEWTEEPAEPTLWIPKDLVEDMRKEAAGDPLVISVPQMLESLKIVGADGFEIKSAGPTGSVDGGGPNAPILLHTTKVGELEEIVEHSLVFENLPNGDGPLLLRISDEKGQVPFEAIEDLRTLISQETGRSVIAVFGDTEVRIEELVVDKLIEPVKEEEPNEKAAGEVVHGSSSSGDATGESGEVGGAATSAGDAVGGEEILARAKIVLDVRGCARCGDDHDGVKFYELTHPIGDYDLWAKCPENDEPILLKVIVDQESDAAVEEKAEEGDDWGFGEYLDARAAERDEGGEEEEDLLDAFNKLSKEEVSQIVKAGLQNAVLSDESTLVFAAKTGRLPGR